MDATIQRRHSTTVNGPGDEIGGGGTPPKGLDRTRLPPTSATRSRTLLESPAADAPRFAQQTAKPSEPASSAEARTVADLTIAMLADAEAAQREAHRQLVEHLLDLVADLTIENATLHTLHQQELLSRINGDITMARLRAALRRRGTCTAHDCPRGRRSTS